jgi:hypothetical protein
MRIYQQPLAAQDLNRAVACWVEHFGARHLATFDPAGLAFVEVGDLRIMFERGGTPSRCYLATEDAAVTLERLLASGLSLHSELGDIFDDASGIFGEPAIESLAMVLDTEGNMVGISSRRPHQAE